MVKSVAIALKFKSKFTNGFYFCMSLAASSGNKVASELGTADCRGLAT